MKIVQKFFINSCELRTLHILDNFFNLLPRKYSLLSNKKYKYYTILIKKYRILGLLHSKKIKLDIINKKVNDFTC